MASLSNTDLKSGVVFKDGGVVYTVIKYEHNFRGRGGSVVKVKVRNIKTGATQEKSYRQNEKVDAVDTFKKSVQYLYSDGSNAYFMDNDTFEQIALTLELVGDQIKYLTEGEKAVALFLEGSIISIEIPKSVELKVEYTEPGVKGNTATNAMKKAKLQNGLQVDVPLFVKVGDTVKINTETGAYTSRA